MKMTPDNIQEVLPFNHLQPETIGTLLMDYCEKIADEYMGGGSWTLMQANSNSNLLFAVPPSGNYTISDEDRDYYGAMDSITLGACVTLSVFTDLLMDNSNQPLVTLYMELKQALRNNPNIDTDVLDSFID